MGTPGRRQSVRAGPVGDASSVWALLARSRSGRGAYAPADWKSSIGLPAGASRRICRPTRAAAGHVAPRGRRLAAPGNRLRGRPCRSRPARAGARFRLLIAASNDYPTYRELSEAASRGGDGSGKVRPDSRAETEARFGPALAAALPSPDHLNT